MLGDVQDVEGISARDARKGSDDVGNRNVWRTAYRDGNGHCGLCTAAARDTGRRATTVVLTLTGELETGAWLADGQRRQARRAEGKQPDDDCEGEPPHGVIVPLGDRQTADGFAASEGQERADPGPARRRPLSLCENETPMRPRKTFVIAGLWAFLVVVAVHFFQFPGSVPDFKRASGGGTLLDASPAFTPDGIYDRLTGYGEAGRRNYSFRNVTVDVLLPLSVLPFLLLLVRRGLAHYPHGPILRGVLLSVPVAYVVFDLLENASVLALLANYPERMTVLAVSLPYTTLAKRAALLLALGIPLVMLGFEFMRRKRVLSVGRP